jgi:hypothetical protein
VKGVQLKSLNLTLFGGAVLDSRQKRRRDLMTRLTLEFLSFESPDLPASLLRI